MRNTLSTLIVRHGDNLLRRSGWPETVGVTQVAPGVVPGWLAVCGVLSAAEILALTTHLCQPLNYGRAQLLTASAQRLAGTPVRLHLYPVQAYPHPATVRECTEIRLPYAQEWLTTDEYADLLAFLKASADGYVKCPPGYEAHRGGAGTVRRVPPDGKTHRELAVTGR